MVNVANAAGHASQVRLRTIRKVVVSFRGAMLRPPPVVVFDAGIQLKHAHKREGLSFQPPLQKKTHTHTGYDPDRNDVMLEMKSMLVS